MFAGQKVYVVEVGEKIEWARVAAVSPRGIIALRADAFARGAKRWEYAYLQEGVSRPARVGTVRGEVYSTLDAAKKRLEKGARATIVLYRDDACDDGYGRGSTACWGAAGAAYASERVARAQALLERLDRLTEDGVAAHRSTPEYQEATEKSARLANDVGRGEEAHLTTTESAAANCVSAQAVYDVAKKSQSDTFDLCQRLLGAGMRSDHHVYVTAARANHLACEALGAASEAACAANEFKENLESYILII